MTDSADAVSGSDVTVDVVVVGFGFAGANAAIAAHDAGASVIVLEKMPNPGGISICSAGGVRIAKDAAPALAYLERTNGDTAPRSVLSALANGMTQVAKRVERLAAQVGGRVVYRDAPGIYPFAGRDTFGFCMVDSVDGFEPRETYPDTRSLGGGVFIFEVLRRNLEARGIEVRLNHAAQRLVRDPAGRVTGVVVVDGIAGDDGGNGGQRTVHARRGVVLACGGFEADPRMQKQYWQAQPVLSCAVRGNTGDGIRMAQSVGADLWHMWHYHGTYGFQVPGFPFGVRTKRLPDWFPGGKDQPDFDPLFNDGRAVKMPWILLDRDGRRFMNEYEPYMQDTGHRPFERYRPETQSFASLPALMVADDNGRKLFPWGQPMWNDPEARLDWSPDNLAEVESGVIGRAESISELAAALQVPSDALEATLAAWNEACEAGRDGQHGRPPSSMAPITTPPYYWARVWPVVSNTQGGPVHDEHQRVLDPFGAPIAGLYAAGELGSVFGHLYLSGGNVAECFIGGALAGEGAARSWTEAEAAE